MSVGQFVFCSNTHYSSPALTSSTPQLNPPLYLARIQSVLEEGLKVKLRWYVQTVSSLGTTSKSSVGPFVRTNHTWCSAVTDVLRIPPEHAPVLQRRKKVDVSDTAASLEQSKNDIFVLPKGWGIKQLQEGLPPYEGNDHGHSHSNANGTGTNNGDGKGEDAAAAAAEVAAAAALKLVRQSSLFLSPNANVLAAAQAPHEVFTGLSEKEKTRGGKSAHEADGSFLGVTTDEEIEGNWRATIVLPRSKSKATIDLGSFGLSFCCTHYRDGEGWTL